MKLASGHTYEEWDAKKRDVYQTKIVGDCNDFVNLQPGNWVVPRSYLKFQDKVYNFKFKPTDVIIMTPSKCGTTWMQEIIWTMLHNPDLNNPKADLQIFARSPFIESDMLMNYKPDESSEIMASFLEGFKAMCPDGNPADGIQIQVSAAIPDRRALKTHFPLSLHNPGILETAKIVFVARNPKDACLSFLHHHRVFKDHNFIGTQDEFVDYFIDGDLVFGTFHEIIKEAWAKRDHPNMYFTFYENLKEDIDGELKKINDFIGAGLNEQQLKNVKEHTSFSSMKARDPIGLDKDNGEHVNLEIAKKDGGFFHKGKSGGWREKLTKEQSDKIDAYVKEYFDPFGITFKF